VHPAAVKVAATIVTRADGRVLLAQRSARQIGAGFWELPGGKIDPGESAAAAAARELEEEVGIRATELRPWIRYNHVFRTRSLHLEFFRAERWSGDARGREGQRIAWVDPGNIDVGPILPSNDRVLLGLGLPAWYAVSSAQGADTGRIRAALERGARLIQLRVAELTADQRVLFARRIAALAAPFGARVMLTGSALDVRRAGVFGAQSTAAELRRVTARPDVRLWIASCHDALDLAHAVACGADAAVLSPVLPSTAHPDRQPLGWDGLATLARQAPIPVYAQGGMRAEAVAAARAAGAVGVAFAP